MSSPSYRKADIEKLESAWRELHRTRYIITSKLFKLNPLNQEARTYLVNGALRRLNVIHRTISTVFETIPPSVDYIPAESDVYLFTICLHASIINLFGYLDNLAFVWVHEFGVANLNGRKLNNGQIGLGRTYKAVRNSFSKDFQDYLSTLDAWLDYLESYRHALANRIPLYIPPNMVDPKHGEEYKELNEKWHMAQTERCRDELDIKMKKISHFKAVMIHDFDDSQMVYFHAQMIADFRTIEQVSYRFLDEYNAKRVRRA